MLTDNLVFFQNYVSGASDAVANVGRGANAGKGVNAGSGGSGVSVENGANGAIGRNGYYFSYVMKSQSTERRFKLWLLTEVFDYRARQS